MTENESYPAKQPEKKGGYPAGPKTPAEVKPPPPAFFRPKLPRQRTSG